MKFWPFKKREKRGWIPWAAATTDNNPRTQSGNLSQIRRALTLYRDLLLCSPLRAFKKDKRIDDPLLSLMEKPCSWMSRAEFYTRLTEDYFLSGNFFCAIKAPKGRIEGLLPFPPGSIYCYAKSSGDDGNPSGDNTDPFLLDKRGFYYQTQFQVREDSNKKTISKISSDDVWHVKNLWQSGPDTLNGVSLWTAYSETLDFTSDILDTAQKFSETGLISPSIVKGISESPGTQRIDLQKELHDFFSQKKQFLTLDDKIELVSAIVQNPASMIMNLSSIASVHIARLMSVPVSLISREDASVDSSGLGLKEAHRFWVKTSGRAFLKIVAEKLSELADPGVRFEFSWRSTQAADMREISGTLPPLVEAGLLTKEKAKEWMED